MSLVSALRRDSAGPSKASKARRGQRRLFQVTAMAFDSDGLTMAVGTASGHCLLYDLRASSPLLHKDHQ